jgi:flagellar protein FlaG
MAADISGQGGVVATQLAGVTVVSAGGGVAGRQNLPAGGAGMPDAAAKDAAARTAPSEAQAQQAAQDLTSYAQQMRRGIRFSVDKASGRIVIKVIDTQSGAVIRQIPPEEVLALSQDLGQGGGVLFNAKA